MIRIAKIVKSNSHVDYIGRVIDKLDVDEPPQATDYGFAQFVSIPLDDTEVVGVIYDSQLANPDYGNYGPRLSSRPDNSVLSPDYLNEQGVLVGILLLGWRDSAQANHHSVPRRVIPVNQDVYRLADEDAQSFHKDAEGRVQLHYYSQVIAHAGLFSVPLIEAILEQLEAACTPGERQRLCVLKQALVWQRTMGGMRL
ncbi:MAG: hypothetical protein AUG75_18300 [Cyanobacteria bacterium 13_1_20CM_4_61_6]|nr:MAG: hypothetical protein AUG75_18300 [Cyanobacteria bacterium 13_1_20CM_4_61_6]